MNEIFINDVRVDASAFQSPAAAAVHELLRQRAVQLCLMTDDVDGVSMERVLEQLLDREAAGTTPSEEECRRYYESHLEEFTTGERVFARHILFQVTPGVSIPALRAKAELTLADLMRDSARFETVARECSNCPSAEHGGSLGELSRGDTVDEFERALFNGTYLGIYPQIVKTRYGFHLVAVDRREAGLPVPYESVRASIASRLSDHSQRAVLVRYVRKLAETAEIRGVDLLGSPTDA